MNILKEPKATKIKAPLIVGKIVENEVSPLKVKDKLCRPPVTLKVHRYPIF